MEDLPGDASTQETQAPLATHMSKETAAIDSLDTHSSASTPLRRLRRRRRSVRRRLFDSILPFAVLVGLTIFAAGVVRIVEMGAAGQSKRSSIPPREHVSRKSQPSFNYELAQAEYEELMRQNADGRNRHPKARNQVAYQLSLQVEAQRDLMLSKGLMKSASANDVMDWTLFEMSGSPRSGPEAQSAEAPSARVEQP